MKRIICVFISVLLCAVFVSIPVSADNSPAAYIIDDADVISDNDEPALLARATEAAEKMGFSIIIASTDDIGSPKTDAHVVEYSDDLYEKYCGINTDGILFLINCDTKYDYISTSGVCINYYSDYRIEQIFDYIWDDMVDGKFTSAAYSFISRAEYFYEKGKANHQQEFLGREIDIFDFAGSFIRILFFTGFAALIVSVSVFAYFSSQYKLEKPDTKKYILENSIYFDVRKDTFVGNITTRTYSPRSTSSGSHSSGGRSSHHSSTHHSHSGGRHGGGGRHR